MVAGSFVAMAGGKDYVEKYNKALIAERQKKALEGKNISADGYRLPPTATASSRGAPKDQSSPMRAGGSGENTAQQQQKQQQQVQGTAAVDVPKEKKKKNKRGKRKNRKSRPFILGEN